MTSSIKLYSQAIPVSWFGVVHHFSVRKKGGKTKLNLELPGV